MLRKITLLQSASMCTSTVQTLVLGQCQYDNIEVPKHGVGPQVGPLLFNQRF